MLSIGSKYNNILCHSKESIKVRARHVSMSFVDANIIMVFLAKGGTYGTVYTPFGQLVSHLAKWYHSYTNKIRATIIFIYF